VSRAITNCRRIGYGRGDVDQLDIQQNSGIAKNVVIVFGTVPTVRNVRLTPPYYAPLNGTQTVEFDLATFGGRPADVTIAILNQFSVSVLRNLSLPAQAAGHISTSWDGRADNGMLVAPGFYTITVTATDPNGNQARGQMLTTIAY
jgi:flagellar hook assembly protein FlgD